MQIPIDGANMTAKGRLIVPFVRWAVKSSGTFILKVSKDVDIELSLRAFPEPPRGFENPGELKRGS